MLAQPPPSTLPISEPERSLTHKDKKDVLYLLYRNEQPEIDRLFQQHDAIKYMSQGIFKAPIQEQLEKGIRVLDSACGPGAWSIDMGNQYPRSTFQGIDISETFTSKDKPENCSFLVHDVTKPLPFPDNHFDFVYQRLLIAGVLEEDWPTVIKNLMRVVKPGGYIELMESMIPDIFNCGPKYGILSEAAKHGALEKGVRLTVSREIEMYLIHAGAINIQIQPLMFPLGHSGPGGEFWGDNMITLYRHQFRDMVTKRQPELEDPEKYEQFLHEATEECIENKSAMLMFNMYAQKPYN